MKNLGLRDLPQLAEGLRPAFPVVDVKLTRDLLERLIRCDRNGSRVIEGKGGAPRNGFGVTTGARVAR